MFNTAFRAYSIVHTACVAACIALVLNYISGNYIKSSKEFTGVIKHVKTHELLLDRSQNDRAVLELYIKYDLRNCFDWSTHVLFLYVTAEYETGKNKRNEVVIHDKIIKNVKDSYEPGRNIISKYYMIDDGRSLRDRAVKLNLYYDIVPLFGFIKKSKLGEFLFTLPEDYKHV